MGEMYLEENCERTLNVAPSLPDGEELIESIIKDIQGKMETLGQFYVDDPNKGYHRLAKQNVNYYYAIVLQRHHDLDNALRKFKNAVHDLPTYKPTTIKTMENNVG